MVQSRCSDESGCSQDECDGNDPPARTESPHASTGTLNICPAINLGALFVSRNVCCSFEGWQDLWRGKFSHLSAPIWQIQAGLPARFNKSDSLWDLSPEVGRRQLLQQPLSHAAFVAFVLSPAVRLKRADCSHRWGLSDVFLGAVLLALSLIRLCAIKRRARPGPAITQNWTVP